MTTRTFRLPPLNAEVRGSVIREIVDWCRQLDEEREWKVVVDEKLEDRNQCQNRLMWAWHGQMAKEMGHDSNYIHGEVKLLVLQPMMMEMERYHSRAVVNNFVLTQPNFEYKHKIFLAHSTVRSSDLTVADFAEFLTRYQRYAAERGVVLNGREDDVRFALMQDAA